MSSRSASDLLNEVAGRGWALSHSPPPYAEELWFPAPPRRPRGYSLLILDVEVFDHHSVQGLHDAVENLRRKFAMPVFVRPGDGTRATDVLTLREALATAGGELLPHGDSIGHRAREVLTIRPNLASDWIRWYRLHREIGSRQEEAIRALVNHSTALALADRILEEANVSPRSARRWLADSSLPPPGAWARASRLLRALLALQRDPDPDVYELAIPTGYSSSESFSNAVFRYFGHGAPKGRCLLGLEGRFREFHERAAGFSIMSGQGGRWRC